jgi:ATP adenylyltransferase
MSEVKPTIQETLVLKPGTLWETMRQRTDYALRCGALQPIPTSYEFVEQNGIRFLVRIVSNLVRKDEAKQRQHQEITKPGKDFNPFLPYEENLFVADISQTHVSILNKFNVMDYHLLIITRAFEEQETLLTLPDVAAMGACLREIEGLAFYNSGKIAGASQRHKHLQFVPLPLAPTGLKIPIEPAIASTHYQGGIGTIPDFPFVHAIAQLDPTWLEPSFHVAEKILDCYYMLLQTVGLRDKTEEDSNWQPRPYNLLATREWMMVVPRSQESFEAISINSLGFAGALLVRNEEQLKRVRDCGPLTILRNVVGSQ